MKNPIDRGPLMAPADGGDGGGGGKAIEFKSKKIKREPNEAEKREMRENQLKIVALWREDGIKWRSQENEGRIRPAADDIKWLEKKNEEIGKRNYREETVEKFNGQTADRVAEGMVLEVLDAQGKTQPYVFQRGPKVIREGYDILQGQGFSYFPCEYDDKKHGTDGILLMEDPDEPSTATAISLDITTNIAAINEKRMRDLNRISAMGDDPSKVYWYDSRIKKRGDPPRKSHELFKPEERFSQPKEGLIESLNLSVYVPSDLVEDFGSVDSSFEKAHEAMERLAPYILHQMKIELSEMALRALGMVRFRPGTKELDIVRIPNLDEILMQLEDLQNSERGKNRRLLPSLQRALKTVYEEEENLVSRKMGMRRVDAQRSLSDMVGFKGFSQGELAAE